MDNYEPQIFKNSNKMKQKLLQTLNKQF